MTKRSPFTPDDYKRLTTLLDEVFEIGIDVGMTEAEAATWLKDFVAIHYLPVFRGIR